MSEKFFKKVLPCGTLTSRTGQRFWLISPEPLPAHSWMHYYQQRWSVVDYESIDFYTTKDSIVMRYSFVHDLITTNPDIEYGYFGKWLEVWEAFEVEGEIATFEGEAYEPTREDLEWLNSQLVVEGTA